MDEVTRSSGLRIGLSLSIAFLFHTILALVIMRWAVMPTEQTVTTLNVQLQQVTPVDIVKPETGATSTSVQERDLITSNSESTYSEIVQEQPIPIEQPPTKQPATQSRIVQPRFQTIGDRPSPSAESSDAFSQFNQLFIQKKDLNQQTEQISTKKAAIITPYMEQLIQKLSLSQNYDRQYQLSKLKVARSLVIELKLLANGALENVRILKESGDADLDKAAMRAAFMASPFPPPPVEDMKRGYTYEFELVYTPRETLENFKR